MARIRTIKPKFWDSPDLPADPWARLAYIAMWNWADDYGRGSANIRELLGFVFPNDEHIDSAEFRRILGEVRRAFGVKFYKVGGRPYYAIATWEDHQKIDKRSESRHPRPEDGTDWDPTVPDLGKQESSTEPAESPPSSRRALDGDSALEVGSRKEEVGSRKVSEAEPSDAVSIARQDVERLCARLADRIEQNGSKRPTVTTKWRDSARLLIDKDGHTEEQVRAAIDWSQNHEFWRGNILSMPKLREKYDQMRLQAQGGRSNTRQSNTDQMFDRALERAKAREHDTE